MPSSPIQPPLRGSSLTTEPKRRILLVDDHPIVQQGLTEMLNYEVDLTVCRTAVDLNQALDRIEKLKPDLVVMDISLKSSNGIEVSGILAGPRVA